MTDIPENIARFNLTALVVLRNLYEEFPAPIEVDAMTIGVSALPGNADSHSNGDSETDATHVLTWLAEEGFLRFETQTYGGTFFGVRLTQKGIAVLGTPMEIESGSSVRTPETLIARMSRVLKSGAEGASAEAVKLLVMEIFKLSMKWG